MSPKKGRPFEEKPRRGRIEVRTSSEEERMLDYCAEKTGKNKAAIIRQGIQAIYAQIYDEYTAEMGEEPYDVDECYDLKVSVSCPHCDSNNRIEVDEYEVDCQPYNHGEYAMGEELDHTVECEYFVCKSCGGKFAFSGRVCEYPLGVVNFKEIKSEPIEE